MDLLESLGHSVVMADNGLEAVDKLRAAMLFITSGNDTGLDQSPDSLQTRITVSTAPKYNSNVSSTVTSPEFLTGSVCGPFDLCLMDLTLPVWVSDHGQRYYIRLFVKLASVYCVFPVYGRLYDDHYDSGCRKGSWRKTWQASLPDVHCGSQC